MEIIITILCTKTIDGVINTLNVKMLNNNITSELFDISKNDLMQLLKEIPKQTTIKTINGTTVSIIKGEYLRTDGDNNVNNDLLDLDECV